MKKRTLIFGMSGLLGSHLGRELSDFTSLSGTYYKNNLSYKNSIKFKYSPLLNNLEKLLLEYKPEVIINASGFVSVDGCEEDPVKAMNLNANFINGLIFLLKKLSLDNCHVVQISTPAVYGKQKNKSFNPWVETDFTNPLSVYASTKLLADLIVQRYNGPKTIIRSDIYGINSLSEKSLMWWIIKSAYNGERMEGWENILFNPISAGHLSKIIKSLISDEITGLFNIGCINECNKYDFAAAVCNLLKLDANIERAELVDDSIRPYNTITDCSKLFDKRSLGLTWEEDLERYIKVLPKFPSSF